jgi:hypothetical protein
VNAIASRANSRAAPSSATASASSACVGARYTPPTRTLTGWISRPPVIRISVLPAFFRRSAPSTTDG